MRIALDVMGGDHAPEEVLAGAKEALASSGALELMLVGDLEAVLQYWPEAKSEQRIEIVHCDEVIGMDEHPAMAYRKKKNASITVASRLVRDGEAQGVVSAGSTGAQMVAALFEIGRMEGVNRPAIASCIPTLKGPKVMLDIGANTDSMPENLRQFSWLGKIYCSVALGIPEPKVYLLSNGVEAEKGDELVQKTYSLLMEEEGLNFCGSVEGRDLFSGEADVVVTDGFSGNIALKTMEGTAEALFTMMREAFMSDARSKLGAALLKPALKQVKSRLDYEEVGGAPLLGVRGLSVVCHGSSKAKAVRTALLKAGEWIDSGLLAKLGEHKF
ncbi:MAG: phosphate acyltransferase PlsX [Clostridiales bacterium]|nr:phosphate acyltransferase PlsX [Clostridiales bacterium]